MEIEGDENPAKGLSEPDASRRTVMMFFIKYSESSDLSVTVSALSVRGKYALLTKVNFCEYTIHFLTSITDTFLHFNSSSSYQRALSDLGYSLNTKKYSKRVL